MSSEAPETEERILTANKVNALFMACLFKPEEDTTNHIPVKGIVNNVGFHPERLEARREEIEVLLAELPNEFMKTGGGGMSFLNACMDKQGHQWGEHPSMEQLFQLGMGIGKVTCLLPRDAWAVLPGGMPYYSVDL